MNYLRALEHDSKPLRDKPVADIGTDDVLGVLRPLWTAKPVTAARTRDRIERVLDAAKAKGHRTGDNPPRWRGNLRDLLPKRRNVVAHHEAVPYAEVPGYMAKLRALKGVGCAALEFAVLTAARPGEVLGAKWSEIDLKSQIWTVPAVRMKGGREHRVPLSPRCVTILRHMAKARVSDFVFPGERADRPVSGNTLRVILRRLGADATVHGFRSTFRDWCGDRTTYPREVAEAALAHLTGDAVERTYRRGDAFDKRCELMRTWANYCEPKAGNVVTLRRRIKS